MNKQPTSRMCFVCGERNPAGAHVRFYEQDDGSILAKFTGEDHHQGYPGRMHGGVITAVLDETVGRAIMSKYGEAVWGVTAELKMRFRKPVPLGVELTVTGRVIQETSRAFHGTGEILLPDGVVAAECTGTYVKMRLDRIANFDPVIEEWYVRPDPEENHDPEG